MFGRFVFVSSAIVVVAENSANKQATTIKSTSTATWKLMALPASFVFRLSAQSLCIAPGVDFPLLPDPASDVSQRWEIDFLPTSHLVDAQGRLRYTAYGEVDWDDDEVRATLRTLLEEIDPGSAPAD